MSETVFLIAGLLILAVCIGAIVVMARGGWV